MTEEAHDGKHYVAHNKFYEQVKAIFVYLSLRVGILVNFKILAQNNPFCSQVLVPKIPNLLGSYIKVKILDTKKHCLISEVVHLDKKMSKAPVVSMSCLPLVIMIFLILLRYIWMFFL